MTVTHELGHVTGGLIGGATLIELQLRPWHLPHSMFAGDKHPLATLWAGFALGCVVPLLVAAIVRHQACWFVAWFCVLANGAYLLFGYFSGDGELDSTKMIRAGAHPIALLGAAAVMLVVGYIKFRKSCVSLMSGAMPAMTRRGLWISGGALAATLVIQAIIATAAQSSL
jgi:hypothetical protein